MWIRVRPDIGWWDLLVAMAIGWFPSRRQRTRDTAARVWQDRQASRAARPTKIEPDVFTTLSVRSGFDLLLRTLKLPAGSEVLMSAWTVPDMVTIVRAHRLVPVPVDIDQNGNIDLLSLQTSVSSRSRVLVVAHLFGGRMPLDHVAQFAAKYHLLLVEDGAQCFTAVGQSGHAASDVVLHSFGPIKTATALGGAIVRVADAGLRQRMHAALLNDPVQPKSHFRRRVTRFALLKLLASRPAATLLFAFANWRGVDIDCWINGLGRGFASDRLLEQLRQQPSPALNRFLAYRLERYRWQRIERRMQLGHALDQRLGNVRMRGHSYWVFPIFVEDGEALVQRLRKAGFDATTRSRMCMVPPVADGRAATRATANWSGIVFLPWHPELPPCAVDQMAKLIAPSDTIAPSSRSRDPRPMMSSQSISSPHCTTKPSGDFVVRDATGRDN